MRAKVKDAGRTPRLALICSALAALASLATAPSAQAEPCPNEAVREAQRSTFLPECRAWEMVSAAEKDGNPVVQGSAVLAAGGDRVLYAVFGGTDQTSTGARPRLLATRTEAGWVTSNPMPPRAQMHGATYLPIATTPDLSGWLALGFDGVGLVQEVAGDSLLRLTDTGAQTLLHRFPDPFVHANEMPISASEDLGHVYVESEERLDPAQLAGTSDVFDLGGGAPQTVSLLPGGGVPQCGVGVEGTGFVVRPGSAVERWVSADGSRLFFLSRGNDAPGCTAPYQLYMRDRETETTTEVSAPPTGAGPDLGVERFLQAAPDGSWAFFRTATSYSAADDADGDSTDMDVYRWTEGGGLSCVTCAVLDAEVTPGEKASAISRDGSRVYFESSGRLGDAPPRGVSGPDLYVLRGGAVHFVAELEAGDDLTPLPFGGGDLTPDGSVLLFRSRAPDLNALSGSDNGGLPQFYRYDDGDGSLTCLSCLPSGRPTASGVAQALAGTTLAGAPQEQNAVTDDGETVFFTTPESLLPEDTDGVADVYEWHAGALSLLTDGSRDGVKEFAGATPDGRDAFVLDSSRLTFDAADDALKLYDVRAGGGFSPPLPVPAGCEAEGCREGASAAPPPPSFASDALVSAGNPPARKRRHHRKRHRRHHRHHHHRVGRSRGARGGRR